MKYMLMMHVRPMPIGVIDDGLRTAAFPRIIDGLRAKGYDFVTDSGSMARAIT